jgi:uncharacterized OB-fold protein
VTDEPLRLRQRITLRYRFAAGRYASRFFAALREEGRILATLDGAGRALVPPRPVSGLDDEPTVGWAEVGPTATLAGFTVVHVPFIDPMTGEQRPVPYGFGLVRFDGAVTNIYHLVDETDPARLRIGMPLEPVWREPSERVGSLADIVCFRPVQRAGDAAGRAARPVPEPPPPAPLVSEQKIDLPFTYTAGPAHRAFLRGLAAGRVTASVGDDGERYVPARPFAPDGRRLTRTEEVAPRGVLVAATVARHLPGAPAFGLVRVDGSETPMLHRLGDGAEALSAGAAVEAVFASEPREPSVLAISHFRPA